MVILELVCLTVPIKYLPFYVIDEKANIKDFPSKSSAAKELGMPLSSLNYHKYDNILVVNSETGLPAEYML